MCLLEWCVFLGNCKCFKIQYYSLFQIVKPGPPQTPINLEVTAVDGSSISLAWTPGFNGGYNQSFDIQVFDETTGQRVLKLRNIRRVEGNKTTITGLTPQTRYAMKIRAWNRDGYSNFSAETIIKTRRKSTLSFISS